MLLPKLISDCSRNARLPMEVWVKV